MPPLKWDTVGDPIGGGGRGGNVNFADSFNPLTEALAKMAKTQRGEHAAGEIQKAMGIDDPEIFIEAMRRNNFDITPENYEFFTNRVGQLLGEKKSRQDLQIGQQSMALAASQEERAKQLAADERKSRGITDAGNLTQNEISSLNLKEGLAKFDLAQQYLTLSPEAAKRSASIRELASNGDLAGARKLASDAGTQEMFIKAGWGQDGINSFLTSLDAAASAARKQEEETYTHQQEVGARPEEARIADLERQKRGFVLESDLGRLGHEEDVRARGAQKEDEDYARQEKALAVYKEILASPAGGSLNSIHEAARNYPGLDPSTRTKLVAAIEEGAGAFANRSKEEILAEMQANDPYAPTGPRQVGEGYTAPAGSLVDLIDRNEGGGDYSSLFNNAHKSGGEFAGIDVSKMTIGELNRFAQSGYGDYVAGKNNGTFASPFGRYQIVNSTLQDAAKHLGLSPDTVFNKETQDKLFTFLVNQRLGGRGSTESQITGLRNEWAGLKNVDDATLRAAIDNFKQGNVDFGNRPDAGGSLSGLQGAIQGTPGSGKGTVSYDETYGASHFNFLEEKAKQKDPLSIQDLTTLSDGVKNFDNDAAIVTDALTASDMFGGQSKSVLAAMQNPEVQKKDIGTVGKELKATFGDIAADQMIDEINYVVGKYKIPAGIAQAFIANAPAETYWINPASPNMGIDRGAIDEMFGRFYKLDTPDVGQRMKGALEMMQTIRLNSQGADNLKVLQSNVANAMTEVANLADRKKRQPNIDDKKAVRQLQIAEKALQKELVKLDKLATSTTSSLGMTPNPEPGIFEKIRNYNPFY